MQFNTDEPGRDHGQFFWDVNDGKQSLQGVADWYRGVMHGDVTKY